MGSQTPTSNDRSRTYWTPTMERYFIDLMLDQMHRGSRIGHTFNKQAWTDMLTMFNSKFGSQYDKDVLKGRYTNLWKQFNDIKNLLAQSGFSWDETRQMVVADDDVWDAYIKFHPDARSYKTKAVLNFNDLYLIYGYTTADGRYSRSSHDIDIDDDVQGMNIGDGMGSIAPLNNERSRTDWTAAMDQFFIELMLDQLGKGNKIGSTFNKQAWTDMLALFNVKFGPQHGKRVLRHRYKKLWKYYSDVTILLKQSGFSWDDEREMILADDDVWDVYIKAHPHARSYRTKTLPNYKDLGLIYGNAINNGMRQDKDLENDILGVKAGEGRDGQTPAGSDRSRTYWTPPMDHYLIDLLLDQVHRGNKLGQTFITQAWTDMVASFNSKFRSQHDKDVLKNRFKHLRRQYNDIRILLQQSGFSWDETREMVTAEDHVWDAYTKAHPDARTYRVKTVPSYHKLCVIYGQESSDGRYSRLARYADPICDVPVLMSGEAKDAESPTSTDSIVIDWTPSMDHYFIDLMIEQRLMSGGHKVDEAFSEQAWAHMVTSFNDKFGLHCDKYFLENRYMFFMKQYNDISNLLNYSEFAWNEAQQTVTAEDHIWEAYIKVNPDAVSFRDKYLGNYGDLCKIFGIGMLDESFSCPDLSMEIDPTIIEVKMDGASEDSQFFVSDSEIPDQGRKRQTAVPSAMEHSRKAQKTMEGMQEEALDEMTVMVTTLVNNKEDKNSISIESAIDALQAIPDIDDDLLLDACDLLEDDKKAKTFLALDVTLRKKWLLRKLRP